MRRSRGLLGNFIDYIDNVVIAAAVFFLGSMVAKIVRELVETTLSTIDFDRWANMGGVDAVTGNKAISRTIGTVAYILIIIPVAVIALDLLDISSITEPAQRLLTMVFEAVPLIVGACLLLGLGYVISRWVAELIRDVLPSLGADRAINELGILPEGRTASGVIATIVTIAVMIFFAIAATDMLGFPQLTYILETVLAQAGNVVFGAVLIALGVIIAKILQNLIADTTASGNRIERNLLDNRRSVRLYRSQADADWRPDCRLCLWRAGDRRGGRFRAGLRSGWARCCGKGAV